MLAPTVACLSPDHSQVELRLVPNTHGPISADQILELLQLPEFISLCPNQHGIDKAIKEVNALCGQDSGEHELFFVIADRFDGHAEVVISDDKMQATLTLHSAYGGKDVALPDILKVLKANNVKMGLSKPKIFGLIKRLDILPPGEQASDVIAVGKLAENGQHAELTRKVSLARERLLKPQERDDGTVDMRNLGSMITVKPNDVLMVKSPATEGVAGYNVHGDVLQQKPGKDKQLVPGTGTSLNPHNQNELIATEPGQPVETRTGMQVDDTLEIKEVNVRYGHVNFKGSVLIKGDVQEGMQVKATGDVTVMGFVDSASIEADGDIVVSKGIIGRQDKSGELSTQIKAKGQICAQFVQYSNLEAEGEILVTKQLLHSHTQSKETINVCDPSNRRGDLVGGIAKANKGIRAVAFGATAGTKTVLYCAMEHSNLKAQLKELDESVRAMVVANLDIEARLRQLPPKTEWQNDPGMVEQVKMMFEQKKVMEKEKQKEELEQQLIQDEVDDYFNQYFIQANKHIYTNVEVHIGKATNRAQREHGQCVVKNINQEIVFDYNAKS
ncbi:DUF342 domain-containing protein [Shewanella maritima]|uniref:DUF342 domain-containing protein n=1 Tax=Shewanella maritima TaxID=2520507 RepID=UPI0037355A6C